MCRVMKVHSSGFYAWKQTPDSACTVENRRLLGQIKQCWIQDGSVYGYRKISDDLRDIGGSYGEQRVYRLTKAEGLRSQTGYRRRPRHFRGKPASVTPNHLARHFGVDTPNEVWVSDITYIRTHEG
jgi:putative transposase